MARSARTQEQASSPELATSSP
ncbi:hypothetical protein A2U01_0101024, partial [Trifolium medium]|nr:hypothetical protein [Trifolium medium]